MVVEKGVKTITIELPTTKYVQRTDMTWVSIPAVDTEQWDETDYRCLYCGEESVYVDPGDGDYYVGPQYLCAACGGTFSLQDGSCDELSQQRAALIRAAREA